MSNDRSPEDGQGKGLSLAREYVFLIVSGILLLLEVVVFALLPEEVAIR